VYDVDSLEAAFEGPFKHQKTQDSIWEPFTKQLPKEQCSPTATSSAKYSPTNFQLKHLSIAPLFSQPILVIPNKRTLTLAVDTVTTKHNNDIRILFIATEYGTILKHMVLNMNTMVQKNHAPTTCLLEELEVLDPSTHTKAISAEQINNIILLNQASSRSLLIATTSRLIKLPIANCQAQTNYFNCLSLMDPYCIWDSKAQKCLLIFQTNETLAKISHKQSRDI
jgi:chondroitin sulfate proteoglycan 4